MILLCNDIILVPNKSTGQIEFHGSSTDEISLLGIARALGYDILQKNAVNVTLKMPNVYGPK